MFFSDILDIHNSYQRKSSYNDILGDGFMMETNPIYRNVQAFSLKIGCRYVEAYSEYLLLPFHELPNIVERREIPYVPTARLMKNVETSRPGVFTTDDVPVPKSHHLHEAAHVIAEHFLEKLKVHSLQEKILKAIMAESFANTVDALVCVRDIDDIHHFFIQQNSYMHPQKKFILAMNGLLEGMGFRFTFMLMFFIYVHANFLKGPLSKKSVHDLAMRYAKGIKISVKNQKNIRTVSGMGEELDPQFRYTTTGNYFKQLGFEGEIEDLIGFPFMKIFESHPGFRKTVEAFCDSLQ